MSGVEVVGFVLGAIPLVISGLEHYADGVRWIKVISDASTEFKTLARKLRAEEVVYRNTLTILLSECLDIDQQALLMQNPDGDEWSDPSVTAALTRRLQDSYESFKDHVKSIRTALVTIRERLQIDSAGRAPFEDAKSFRQAYKRFRFALHKSAYLDLLDKIRDDNTHIRLLTEQSQILLKSRKKSRPPNYEVVRTGAISVFEILRHYMQVSCGAAHKASLYLQSAHEVQGEAARTFRIMLHHDEVKLQPKQKALPWQVQEAEMRLLDGEPAAVASSNVACITQKRAVRFADAAGSVGASSTKPAALPQAQLNEIQDLCHSIDKLQSMQCGVCLGVMTGLSTQQRHGLYWPKDRLAEPSSLEVSTLASVLRNQTQNVRQLTNADARRLAVPLATWMLRLHNTPWLVSSWGKNDITLIRQNGKLMAEHAFLTQSLKTGTCDANASSIGQHNIATIVIRNPTLFALGVVLIELCMGQSIDEMQVDDERNPDGTKHELSDYRTAHRLLRLGEISDRFGSRWSDVVRRCIYCDLNQTKASLEDSSFRSAVHNNIVAELEEDYRQFFHL